MHKLIATLALLLVTLQANAQGRWETGPMAEGEGVYSATINDNGVVFGRYCYFKDDTCVWMLANDLGCTPGATYPALATSRDSAHVQLVCGGKSPTPALSRYFLKPYDTVEALVDAGGVLGVAVVADNGNFRVYRFDLAGAKRVLEQADAIYARRAKTKDQSL